MDNRVTGHFYSGEKKENFFKKKFRFCLTTFDIYTAEKNWDFLTSFSLSNKFTYLAFEISYRKISEINVKAAKIKILRLSFSLFWKTPNDICIVKELWSKSRFCWEMRNGSRTILDILRLRRSFYFFFGMKFSFSKECLRISLLQHLNSHNHCFSLPKSPLPWR
jgi:hypothetical protein